VETAAPVVTVAAAVAVAITAVAAVCGPVVAEAATTPQAAARVCKMVMGILLLTGREVSIAPDGFTTLTIHRPYPQKTYLAQTILMKNISLLILIGLFLACSNSQAQTSNATQSRQIKQQAEKMGQLFVKGDFKAFIKFTYPKLVELMGGEQAAIGLFTKSLKDMEADGVTLKSITIGEPSAVINYNNELQCIVPEILEMKVPNGRLVSESSLVGVSTDGGKSWYFIDASGKDIKTMNGALPNLSTDLVLPLHGKPVFYKE
jgi:hypothetical protein